MISVLLLKHLVVMCDINHEHDLGASIEVIVNSVQNGRAWKSACFRHLLCQILWYFDERI